MELALIIIVILGIVLFVVGYLKFVTAGFKQHPVTGIISIFPVINILVVPSLWHKTSRVLIVGFVGLLMVVGAWFMGAEKSIQKYLDLLTGKEQSTSLYSKPETSTQPLSVPTSVSATVPVINGDAKTSPKAPEIVVQSPNKVKPSFIVLDESKMKSLPNKALYRMTFEEIPLKNLSGLGGRIVRILDNNLVVYEGRVSNVSASSLFVKPTGKSIDVELPVSNIKKLSLMVKKPF